MPYLDRALALPDHSDDGAAREKPDKSGKERFLRQIGVVTLCNLLGWVNQLHGDELEALLLEAADDLANYASLHAVRFDGDERALARGAWHTFKR